MSRRFKTVSSLQSHLKSSILEAIENKIVAICIDIVQKNIQEKVYDAYIPDGDSYDRTFDLINSVTVGNLKIGTKYATFEIFMDTEKITPQIRNGVHDYGGWNAHADMHSIDVSEYIPLWIEEGTSGSLWDREGAHYMQASHYELSGGQMAQELADRLRQQGWMITTVS